jgi:hypothetical protein
LAAAAFKAAPTVVGLAGAGLLGMGAKSAYSNWQQGNNWTAVAEGALAAPGALPFMQGKSLSAMFGKQALSTTGRSAQALVNGKAIQTAIQTGQRMSQSVLSQGRSRLGMVTAGGDRSVLRSFEPRVLNGRSGTGKSSTAGTGVKAPEKAEHWASGAYSASSVDVQPRHMTKLEHALRFKNKGNPKQAAKYVQQLKEEMGPERYAALKRAYLQQTPKGSALTGNTLKGDPYRVSEQHIDLMKPDDDFSKNAHRRKPLDGYFDVIAHGVEKPGSPTTKIRLQTLGRDVEIDHRILARLIRSQSRNGSYDGKPIRLLSCLTGNAPNGFAQNLANKLGQKNLAPSDIVWASKRTGKLVVSPGKIEIDPSTGKEFLAPKMPQEGEWRAFEPKKGTKSKNFAQEKQSFPRHAESWLANKGYSPNSGERLTTKEQWKEWSSKQRRIDSSSYKNQHIKLSQPGGLTATEGTQIVSAIGKYTGKPGPKSHPLTEHAPQKPLSEIRHRLTNNPKMLKATKFTSRSKMESSIAKTLQEKKAEINAWLNTSPPAGKNMPTIKYSPKMGNLGTGYERSIPGGNISKTNSNLENIAIVLKSNGNGGYIIQTAYPD